jgi:hypothetical protein
VLSIVSGSQLPLARQVEDASLQNTPLHTARRGNCKTTFLPGMNDSVALREATGWPAVLSWPTAST